MSALVAALLAFAPAMTDAQVRQAIIDESIADYRERTGGACPCPYNRMRNGNECGKRSAWSKGGGEAPLCYAKEVSDEMVGSWRAARGR